MLTNLQEITVADFIRLAEHNINMGDNLLVFGPPGIGKTEIPGQVVAKNFPQYDFHVLDLQTMEAPDLIGVPHADLRKNVTRFLPPEHLTSLSPNKKFVLQLDEIDKCLPELQSAILTLLLSRKINMQEYNIAAIFLSGNEPDDHAFSKALSHALTSRTKAYRMRPDFESWRKHNVEIGTHPLIVGFLNKHTDLFHKKNRSNDETSYKNPDPRAWTSLHKHIASVTAKSGGEAKLDVDFATLLISGAVGHEASVKFKVWFEYYKQIDEPMDRLLKNGVVPDTSNWSEDMMLVAVLQGFNLAIQAVMNGKFNQANHIYTWFATQRADFVFAGYKCTLVDNVKAMEKSSILDSFNNMVVMIQDKFTSKVSAINTFTLPANGVIPKLVGIEDEDDGSNPFDPSQAN